MEFLEDLFDRGDNRRGQNKGGQGYRGHHNDDDDHDRVRNESGGALSCIKCSKPVMAGAKFCPGCGTEIAAGAFCAKCGTRLAASAAFCHECGTKTK